MIGSMLTIFYIKCLWAFTNTRVRNFVCTFVDNIQLTRSLMSSALTLELSLMKWWVIWFRTMSALGYNIGKRWSLLYYRSAMLYIMYTCYTDTCDCQFWSCTSHMCDSYDLRKLGAENHFWDMHTKRLSWFGLQTKQTFWGQVMNVWSLQNV